MIDALQRVVSQLEQLPPEEQAELADTMQRLLDKRKNHVLVYGPHTDEEFEALLTELDQATPEDVPAILARQPKRWVKQDESINADA
jgi:uncharacterized protein (DUF58 family)